MSRIKLAIARVQALPSVPERVDASGGFFVDRSTKSSPMTMSSTLNGAAGLTGNSGRNTADALRCKHKGNEC